MLIDTHAHLDFPEFDNQRVQLFEEMRAASIQSAIIPAVCEANWQRVIHTANQHKCYFALGIHPWYTPCSEINITNAAQNLTALIEQHHTNKHFVAIGECGLDKLKKITFSLQLKLLTQQLKLAKKYQLPVILHCVKAHNEMLKCLSDTNLEKGGVIHGYTSNIEIAKEYLKLGFKLGIGGMILNPNAKKLRHTVANLPIDAFLLETDSPAMSPTPNTINTPLILPKIVNEISCLQKKTTVYISKQLQQNAMQTFVLERF